MEMLSWAGDNWHKILVVLIALLHAWKFFMEYIRPIAKDDEEVVIKIPKKGLTIKIERNDD